MWALLPLLLATALVTWGLNDIAFNGDEVRSLVDAAGILPSGPQSLLEVHAYVSPEQAPGWPLLIFLWVRLVGWSEVAVRALPYFAGLLTLAMVYRAGHDLFAPRAGLFAALLLSTAVFLHSYMQHARAFTLVTLFATLCLWSYWRCALDPRRPGRSAQAALLLGAAGLLNMHYYASLLLPVLGLYHLLFVPRDRRWWRPVLPVGLAFLLTLLQLPTILQGLERTTANQDLHSRALTAPELLAYFLRYLANDLLAPTPAVGGLLAILLPAALLVATLLRLRARRPGGAGWLLLFVSAALLTLFTAVNEVLRALAATRIRYLIALWPLTALLAGAGFHQLSGRYHRLLFMLPALWLLHGAWLSLATPLRHELGAFRQSEFHHVANLVRGHIPPTDLLIIDFPLAKLDAREFHRTLLGAPWEVIYRYHEDPVGTVRELHSAWPFVSLLYLTEHRPGFAGLPAQLGRVLCERVLDEQVTGVSGVTLERYALHSVANCPDMPARLEYEAGIRLAAPKVRVMGDTLRLDAHFHSEDHALLANYSLALHIIDPRSGERVAQGDVGIGPGNIVPLRAEVDLGALPWGEYALRVALYDWRDGARLTARDLETGARGDLLTLQRFRVW